MVRRDSGDVTVKRVFEPRLDYARGVTTLMLLGEGVQTRGVWQTLSLIASVPTRPAAPFGRASLYLWSRRRMSRVGVSTMYHDRFSAVWMRPMCEYTCGKLPS